MQQDWLMRQIEMMAAAVARLLLGKGGKEWDLEEELGQERSARLKEKLTRFLEEGQMGKAEDLLFFELDGADKSILAVAINFYRQANALSDEELDAQGFTRWELWEGLGEAAERYGLSIPGFWNEP